MVVELGDGREPWSVARGGVKRWLHCRVELDALADGQYEDLDAWMARLDLRMPAAVLLVTRGDDGYRVHGHDGTAEVNFEDLPAWLQRPEPSKPTHTAARTRPR